MPSYAITRELVQESTLSNVVINQGFMMPSSESVNTIK